MKKKNYIKPFVVFDDIEEQTELLGTVSAGAENQEGEGGWGGDYAKSSSFFCLDDAFEGPIEEANEEFEYSINLDY